MSVRRTNELLPATVSTDSSGAPTHVTWEHHGPRGGERKKRVEHVVERWIIDDGWWSETPIRRACFECQLDGGVRLVVVHDLATGGWHVQH